MPNSQILRDPNQCGAGRGRSRRWLRPLLTAGMALACSPSEEVPSLGAPLVGELRGVVRSAAALQRPAAPSMAGAPVCQSLNERVELEVPSPPELEHRLANAFVYVTGAGAPAPASPLEAVELSEEGCLFHPRVVGLRTGQTLRVVNRDPTLHDVSVEATRNEAWVEPHPFAGMTSERTLRETEVMIPVRCQLHPWMRAWVGVLPHPYFAVSNAAGEFAISGLLPGRYRLEVWHEDLGRRSMEVAVSGGDTTQVEVVYGSEESHAL